MKAAEARPGAQQMDGKHTGTGSTPAAKEAQRGKKKKKVNFFFQNQRQVEGRGKNQMCGNERNNCREWTVWGAKEVREE